MDKIESIKQYAAQNNVPILQEEGWDLIKKILMENGCKSFLELGTAVGHTAIQVALLGIEVVTIERDLEMIEQAKINITEMDLWDRITLIEQDALDVELNQSFDCIFIDAAKAQYERFFSKYSSLLNPHGIIIADNMSFHGLVEHPERTQNRNTKRLVRKIKEFKEFVQNLADYTVEFFDEGDGIAIIRRA